LSSVRRRRYWHDQNPDNARPWSGRSVPYGYPAGQALIDEIISDILDKGTNIYKDLVAVGHPSDALADFAYCLEQSLTPSIDYFLEQRSEFLEIGKAAIARILMQREHDQPLPGRGDSRWYRYLAQQMMEGAEGLSVVAQNRLRIVTFNYDRSLDESLFRALSTSYGTEVDEVVEVLQQIPIVHLHGIIGRLPWQPSISGWAVRRYGEMGDDPAKVGLHLKAASEMIQIIHEVDPPPHSPWTEALAALEESERVVIMGFGFLQKNVERLRLADLMDTGRLIRASSYRLTQNQIDSRIKPLLNGARGMKFFDHECIDFLKSAVPLT
jgi:hypothetical protein